jgi:hypothetical protein
MREAFLDLRAHIEAASRMARLDVVSAKYRAEKVEWELRHMLRERLLPDDGTLNQVACYEAHLSRLFHKTPTSLRLCKPGGSAPLTQLDVEGIQS